MQENLLPSGSEVRLKGPMAPFKWEKKHGRIYRRGETPFDKNPGWFPYYFVSYNEEYRIPVSDCDFELISHDVFVKSLTV